MNRTCIWIFFISLLIMPVLSFASGWELYDDFSSGTFDPQKWNTTSSVSTITVENQQAKLVHASGHINQSGWMALLQNPSTIRGIRATFRVDSCTGDVRARIGGYVGRIGNDHIWSTLHLKASDNIIDSFSMLEGPAPTYTETAQHSAHFELPITIIGQTYTMSLVYHSNRVEYEVEGLGKIIRKFPSNASTSSSGYDLDRIGTRSSNGDGPCTVYVDDVYVLRP